MAEANYTNPILLVIGMAGSGKTSLVKKFIEQIIFIDKSFYAINLDPATLNEEEILFNIDIKDTIKYKDVMKTYALGPNGAILTCMNLFASKFDNVIEILQTRNEDTDYTIFDTPGQIEVFTWSASGTIIVETLKNQFPTIILYVVDSLKCENPITFMSTMLYCCSIVYKMKSEVIIILNKSDLIENSFLNEWLTDFEAFQRDLDKFIDANNCGYSASLARSLNLVLDEFYSKLKTVRFSCKTGDGFDDLIEKINIIVSENKVE